MWCIWIFLIDLRVLLHLKLIFHKENTLMFLFYLDVREFCHCNSRQQFWLINILIKNEYFIQKSFSEFCNYLLRFKLVYTEWCICTLWKNILYITYCLYLKCRDLLIASSLFGSHCWTRLENGTVHYEMNFRNDFENHRLNQIIVIYND